MWWNDDDHRHLSEYVNRVHGVWREGLLPSVIAVGSAWDRQGDRVLLVGVDHRLDPRPASWAAGPGLRARLARLLIKRFGPLPPCEPSFVLLAPRTKPGRATLINVARALVRLRRLDPMYIEGVLTLDIKDADADTRGALRALEFSWGLHTQVAYLGPLRLASLRGTRLFAPQRSGTATAGCVLDTGEHSYLSTAGHLGAAVGERLFFRLRAAFGLRPELPAGRVVAVTYPARSDTSPAAEGIDFALIGAEGEGTSRLPRVTVIDGASIRDKQLLRWNGGKTGPREGWVASALTEVRNGEIQHRNTLLVMGPDRRGAATLGDSGTAVYTLDGELVGHIVGIEGYRSRAIGQAALVQDAKSAISYAEGHVGAIQGVRGDGGLGGGSGRRRSV